MLSAVVLLFVTCGTERWDVKVMKDPAAAEVDLAHPHEATVAHLRELDAPRYSDANERSAVEKKVFFVEAYVLGYKQETDDEDFHLVIADDPTGASGTLISELPGPECAQPGQDPSRTLTVETAPFRRRVESKARRIFRRGSRFPHLAS